MAGPKALANILSIVPYKGGQKSPVGWKLSSNENPLGCSPLARQAAIDAASDLASYPDGGALALRDAIARKYDIDAKQIICGAGSDEVFQLLSRAYLSPKDEILQSEHGFLVYRLVAQQAGAETVSAPETNKTADVDALLARVGPKTKIVFLANPNNPTGTYLNKTDIYRLHRGLPEDVLLVLDGAYAEYVEAEDYDDGMQLAGESNNVLVTRTFSKIHGLAALRLGWAYGPESVIDALNRTRGPFNVSAVAQAAGIAAIEDDEFQARSTRHNQLEREKLQNALIALGLEIIPSVGNFVLVAFQDKDGQRAEDADQYLRASGIVVRNVDVYGLPNYLRISVGTTEANRDVIDALTRFIET